jgi:hypothetical protein
MKRAIFHERLGHISTESLEKSLENPSNTFWMNFELLSSQSPRGFEVIGDFEMTQYESDAEQKAFMVAGEPEAAPGKKLVRLVLEPLGAKIF